MIFTLSFDKFANYKTNRITYTRQLLIEFLRSFRTDRNLPSLHRNVSISGNGIFGPASPVYMSQSLRTFCSSKYFALNGFFSCSCKRGQCHLCRFRVQKGIYSRTQHVLFSCHTASVVVIRPLSAVSCRRIAGQHGAGPKLVLAGGQLGVRGVTSVAGRSSSGQQCVRSLQQGHSARPWIRKFSNQSPGPRLPYQPDPITFASYLFIS